jgi:hypothetical protein
MQILLSAVLIYVAVGAICFAHPASPAMPDDFHWRSQIDIFRTTLADILAWPVRLWRLARRGAGRG